MGQNRTPDAGSNAGSNGGSNGGSNAASNVESIEEAAGHSTPTTDGSPIILFDGVCNLCNGLVRFLIRRDPDGRFRFAPLQSDVGQELLERFDLPTDTLETFVLVEDGECYTKSTAALRTARHLGGVYALLSYLRFVPRPLRDAVYDLVAASRYRVFGRKDRCMIPSPDVEDRFLD